MNHTATALENLLRTIAPHDFADVPLYIIKQADGLPDDFSSPRMCGYTGPNLDLALSEWLKSTGRWISRGPLMVLNDEVISEEAVASAKDDLALQGVLIEQWTVTAALHEGAHALGLPFNLAMPIHETQATDLNLQLAALCREPMAAAVIPWMDHDAAFVRRLLHLCYRASRVVNFRIPLAIAFFGSYYGVSSIWLYAAMLGDEPEKLSHLAITELADIPPPSDFVKLWQRDVNSWLADEKTRRDSQNRAVEKALELFGEIK